MLSVASSLILQILLIDQGDESQMARDASELLENGDAPFNPGKPDAEIDALGRRA